MCNVGDETQYCQDCHRETTVVLDYASGDTICTECALVLGERFVDESSEWRTFSDDGGDDRDPSRVGGAADPFLAHAQLGTTIAPLKQRQANAGAGEEVAAAFVRSSVGPPGPDKALPDAYRAIADMADRLGLVATVRDRAKELFKKAEEARLCPRGRSNRDAFYAACLHIACRNEGTPRTLKELAYGGAAAKKDVGRAAKLIKERFGEEARQATDAGAVSAADYMGRFGSLLGMGRQEVRAAQGAARRLEEGLDVRRNPESIAAAVIFMAMQRAGGACGKSVCDVSVATGVAEATIKDAYKDLSPHATLLFA